MSGFFVPLTAFGGMICSTLSVRCYHCPYRKGRRLGSYENLCSKMGLLWQYHCLCITLVSLSSSLAIKFILLYVFLSQLQKLCRYFIDFPVMATFIAYQPRANAAAPGEGIFSRSRTIKSSSYVSNGRASHGESMKRPGHVAAEYTWTVHTNISS